LGALSSVSSAILLAYLAVAINSNDAVNAWPLGSNAGVCVVLHMTALPPSRLTWIGAQV
jgi:hypothetical protein